MGVKWSRIMAFVFNHRFGSWAGAVFFSCWIGQRFYFHHDQLFQWRLNALIWWLITFQFFLFVVAYLTRTAARAHASGFIESIFPFICAAMPFALLVEFPYAPTYPVALLGPLAVLLLISGTLLVIAGILSLRQSFAIMTEARCPVFEGVYRLTRHPMYVGSIMTTLGTLFQRFGWLNCVWFLVFCLCQGYRAAREERKLRTLFPAYDSYAAEVGWIGRLGTCRKTGPVREA